MTAYNNELVVIRRGLLRSNQINECYNIETNRWSELEMDPSTRPHYWVQSVVSSDSKLYVTGRFETDDAFGTDVKVFELSQRIWSQSEPNGLFFEAYTVHSKTMMLSRRVSQHVNHVLANSWNIANL